MTRPPEEIVPAAIDALVELWRGAFAELPKADRPQVLDGSEVTYISGLYVSVGTSGQDEYSEALSERPGLGRRRTDVVDISCAAWAAGGDTTMKTYRDRASRLFRIARDAVRDNQSLGGAVTRAEVVSYEYRPQRNQRGAGVAFLFVIRAQTL
jgi:hypothetical protein